jgi:hypothetical protein
MTSGNHLEAATLIDSFPDRVDDRFVYVCIAGEEWACHLTPGTQVIDFWLGQTSEQDIDNIAPTGTLYSSKSNDNEFLDRVNGYKTTCESRIAMAQN